MNLLLALRTRRGHINAESSLHLTVQTQPFLDLQAKKKKIQKNTKKLMSMLKIHFFNLKSHFTLSL